MAVLFFSLSQWSGSKGIPQACIALVLQVASLVSGLLRGFSERESIDECIFRAGNDLVTSETKGSKTRASEVVSFFLAALPTWKFDPAHSRNPIHIASCIFLATPQ